MIIVGGQAIEAPGLNVQSFADGLHRFSGRARARSRVTATIVHETAGRTAAGTVSTLIQRGLGVHFIIGPEGIVYQHADLLEEMPHCKGHNVGSIGIEIVSPYYPRVLRAGDPWSEVLEAPWAHEGRYVVPTLAQLEATTRLVAWTASIHADAEGLAVPADWPGLIGRRFYLSPAKSLSSPKPGFYAHHQAGGHADGAFPALFTWLRIAASMTPQEAYDEARRRTKGARGFVDVGDLMRARPEPTPTPNPDADEGLLGLAIASFLLLQGSA